MLENIVYNVVKVIKLGAENKIKDKTIPVSEQKKGGYSEEKLYGKGSKGDWRQAWHKMGYKTSPESPIREYDLVFRLSTSLQSIPQYVEVPPNSEAKQIVPHFSAVLSY